MKIQQIDLYELDVPPIPPIAKYSPNLFNLTLCRIHTDEGVVGLGETYGAPSLFSEPAASLAGQDPLALDPLAQPDPFACALLDIAGQAGGIPLHRFFGQKVRDRVPVSYWSRPMEPHETAAEAADVPCWVQMGGLCLGVKAAYSVHVQATIPTATLPCDELPFTREADVLEEGLVLENGYYEVPDKPGLGVTLDMRVVEKYRVG